MRDYGNMKTEFKNKYQCAPKIWEKFSEVEKKLWNFWFSEFNNVNMYPEGVTKEMAKIAAHNLACDVIWNLAGSFAECLSKRPYIVGRGSR